MKNKTILLPIYLTLTRALILVISPGHALSLSLSLSLSLEKAIHSGSSNIFRVYYVSLNNLGKTHSRAPL